jgi:hypothetical protein
MDRMLPMGGWAVMLPITARLLYLIMLALGRWLKKSVQIRLGLFYQVFSAVVAIYATQAFSRIRTGSSAPSGACTSSC